MVNLNVLILNTNSHDFIKIFSSQFLNDKDIFNLEQFKNEIVKNEKAASLYFKNKYIGKYEINEFNKPVSQYKKFNVSHSHGLVCFVEDNQNIGIDIELIRDVNDDLKKYISSKEEIDYIRNNKNFFEIWTSKESLVKASGTGLNNKINEIPALPINGIKKYKEKIYRTKTFYYQDFIISISREGEEDFNIVFKEEIITL